MAKDIHADKFAKNTIDKLFLYGKYLEEALPVFIEKDDIREIHVYDFFAGPGRTDMDEEGSPIIAARAIAKSLQNPHAGKTVFLHLNELNKNKCERLKKCVDEEIRALLPDVSVIVTNYPFQEAFSKELPAMQGIGRANVIFIDQYGLKEVSQKIFRQLCLLWYTDFLFFLASSTANRFKDDYENVWKYLPAVSDDKKSMMNGRNVHRMIAKAYHAWIPPNARCFLGNFSFKKEANVYGLVFGSGSPKGLEKFLKLAWKMAEEYGGQADYDIDGDGIDKKQDMLFNLPLTKILTYNAELENLILCGSIKTNKDVYIHALLFGVLPEHARKAIKALKAKGKIKNSRLSVSFDAWKANEVQEIEIEDRK